MKSKLYKTILIIAIYAMGCKADNTAEISNSNETSAEVKDIQFEQISWLGESISHEIALRDLHIWGADKYRYAGKIKVGTRIYQVVFTKKLQHVLLYQDNYYFICQEYFGWGYEFDFFIGSQLHNRVSVEQLCITKVPRPILEYQFPSENKDFLCNYQTGMLLLLLKEDIPQMIEIFGYYITSSRVSTVLGWCNAFQTIFLRLLRYDIQNNKFSEVQKNELFKIFAKILWSLPSEKCSESDIYGTASVLMRLSVLEGTRTITEFLEHCYANENFCINLDSNERKTMISRLEDLINRNK